MAKQASNDVFAMFHNFSNYYLKEKTMLIFSDQNQDLTGLSENEISLIKYIRLLSQTKVPNNTDRVNPKKFLRYFMYYQRKITKQGNHNIANCWIFDDNYSEVKFALKEGKFKSYTVHDDIASVDGFLNRHDLYNRIIIDIEKQMFELA